MSADVYSFALRFPHNEIQEWAGHYQYESESFIVDEIAPRVAASGYFTRPDFLELCRWKSPRTRPHVEKNSEEYIREVTRIALSTTVEQLKIEILLLLRGVEWPTASVMLHFTHPDPYPILDYRALWSLGITVTSKDYGFELWWAYVQYCRELAHMAGVSMRTLDKALWQYSKANQAPRR